MIEARYANDVAKKGLSDDRKQQLLEVIENLILGQAKKGLFYTYVSISSDFEKEFVENELKNNGYEVGLDYKGSSSYNLVIRW